MEEDGSVDVDISEYTSASTIDHFFYPDGVYRYEGYVTLEELEEEWVLANVDTYFRETTPGLFE